MLKLIFVLPLAVTLIGCNAANHTSGVPQPQPIPIAGTWIVSVADSSTAPAGWMFTPQTVKTQTIPDGPCKDDANNLASPNTISFLTGSCADLTDIPLPSGQSNWLQTIILGTTTTMLYSSEDVSYVLRYDSADGSTSVTLGGRGKFTSSAATDAKGTTKFNFVMSGPIACLTINDSVSASCTAWQSKFTATLSD